jgi:hypothetical protein
MITLACAGVAVFSVAVKSAQGQTAQAYKIRHTAAGKPDFSGIWQTLGTANWDLEAHAARSAPLLPLGAAGAGLVLRTASKRVFGRKRS